MSAPPAPPRPPGPAGAPLTPLCSRPRRRVNPGFQAQLKLYEAMGCAVDTSSVLYKRYRLEMLSQRFSGEWEQRGCAELSPSRERSRVQE